MFIIGATLRKYLNERCKYVQLLRGMHRLQKARQDCIGVNVVQHPILMKAGRKKLPKYVQLLGTQRSRYPVCTRQMALVESATLIRAYAHFKRTMRCTSTSTVKSQPLGSIPPEYTSPARSSASTTITTFPVSIRYSKPCVSIRSTSPNSRW